jgi:hypothetical protein
MLSIFYTTQLTIPLFQIILLLTLSTLALVLGRLKIAILINFCFVMYWGYVFNLNALTDAGLLKLNNFTFLYFGMGLVFLILFVIGFIFYDG